MATTRPETMYGDVAVAVHPEDPKLSRYIGVDQQRLLKFATRSVLTAVFFTTGRNVFHPLRRIEIPVIGDSELVQMGKVSSSCKNTTHFVDDESSSITSIAAPHFHIRGQVP